MKMKTSQITNRSRFVILALGLSVVWLAGPLAGRSEAGLTIQVATGDAVEAGGTGSIDVLLINDDVSREVSAFSFALSVAAGSGIEFTGVTTDTQFVSYIFGTPQLPPLSFDDFPTTEFTASDASFTLPGYATLSAHQYVGLARVSFSVASNAPIGVVPVWIVAGDNTMVLDALGAPIDLTIAPGAAITVIPATAIPEPSSLALLAIAGVSLAGLRRWAGAAG